MFFLINDLFFLNSAEECPKVECPPGYFVRYTTSSSSSYTRSGSDLPPPRPRNSYQRFYKGGPSKGGRGGYAKGGFSKTGYSKGGRYGEKILTMYDYG